MDFFKSMFGSAPKVDYTELMRRGAQIVDVRTKEEYEGGHIEGSVNIPLNVLEKQLAKIKKDFPVITCCASGMRSGSAKSILESKGYEVYNGGGWASLAGKVA